MTQVTIEYIEQLQHWYQSASSLFGYVWLERDGAIVAGSQEINTVATPPQTGDTLADLNTYIQAALLELTGDASSPYAYPGAIAFNNWGTDPVPYGNTSHNRPFVAVAYKDTYTFGALAIPARLAGEKLTVRVYIFADFNDVTLASPAYNALKAYMDAHAGRLPVLNILELNAQ